MNDKVRTGLWLLVAAVGVVAFAVLALSRGETVNAVWLLTAALCTYAVGYRFYSRFVATKLLRLDDMRTTPAIRRADGLDYVATPTPILFGHHFAAIAGRGPWSVRSWRRKWAICRARCGSWWARYWPDAFRIS